MIKTTLIEIYLERLLIQHSGKWKKACTVTSKTSAI